MLSSLTIIFKPFFLILPKMNIILLCPDEDHRVHKLYLGRNRLIEKLSTIL